jgi:CheY-like chemotaxis protein
VIEALKRAGSDVPLIVYTARDLSATEKKRLSLGSFGSTKHLTKSVDTDEDFLNAVKKMLNRTTRPSKELVVYNGPLFKGEHS